MPTLKHRINITLPTRLAHMITLAAHRDETSKSGKVIELLKQAIETDDVSFRDDFIREIRRRERTKRSVSLASVKKKLW